MSGLAKDAAAPLRSLWWRRLALRGGLPLLIIFSGCTAQGPLVKGENSTMTDADLDSLMSIGYAAISVAGLEISDERAAGDGGEPREVVELREMIVSQSQSPGVRAVGEILFEEHGILQTVPATSETIARLGVAVVVGEAAEDGARRVSVELELSRGLELWRSEAQATMAPAASAAETLRSFRGAVGACLGEAIAALEPVAVGAPF